MKTLKYLVLATVLAAAPACSKKEQEKKAPPITEPAGSAAGSAEGSAAAPGSAEGSAAAAEPEAASDDSFVIEAVHAEKKPDDPVAVRFSGVKVVKADFDPANLEGGTATIEVDLTSLSTDSEKRDAHLASPDYLDTAKFATLTIDIANVKKKDDKTYNAEAKVKLRDIEKTYPVTFEVVDAKDDWIKIKGEHTFPRLDFNVGKKPSKDEGVGTDLTAKINLTLKKT
jgi:polyisoprenoid-binding protein YceI